MKSLEDLIMDMANRGELTHLTVSPHNKQWSAAFCAASPINGYTFVLDDDPVTALKRAITETKVRRRSSV